MRRDGSSSASRSANSTAVAPLPWPRPRAMTRSVTSRSGARREQIQQGDDDHHGGGEVVHPQGGRIRSASPGPVHRPKAEREPRAALAAAVVVGRLLCNNVWGSYAGEHDRAGHRDLDRGALGQRWWDRSDVREEHGDACQPGGQATAAGGQRELGEWPAVDRCRDQARGCRRATWRHTLPSTTPAGCQAAGVAR